MAATSTGRAVGIVTLVLAALLGSAFALGRSLVPDRPGQQTGTRTSVGGAQYAEQPPEPGHGEPTPPHHADPTVPPGSHRDPDAHQPALGGDGPFGTLLTTGTPEVALTFDDGPNPQYTPQVLDVLRQFGVRATFCVVGENARDNPDLIRAIVAGGHTLCNHSWNHDVMLGQRSPETIRADLLRTNEAIRAAAPDAPVAYYRQPGGAWTYPVVSVAEELGMIPLHWTVDPDDWMAPGAARIAGTVGRETTAGSIVLLHDAGGDRQGTVDALYRLLPELTSRLRLEALPVDGAT